RDLTRTRGARPSISSAPASLAGWFGLLLGFCLGSRSAVAVKQNAVRSQIADQRVQVVGQLLIVQKSRHQAFALCRGAKDFARVIERILQIVSRNFCTVPRRSPKRAPPSRVMSSMPVSRAPLMWEFGLRKALG